MGRVRQASPAQRRQAAALRRDGALERLTGITGAIGVATIAAVGILGVYVGKSLPGHHAAPSAGATVSSGSAGQSPGAASPGAQNSINPPSTPTQSAPLPAPVTSGSS